MNEFLNPKSMSTPGAAGALVMLITNTLCYNFPEFSGRYIALALSFVVGAVVFQASVMKKWVRSVFWVVNSLIIFSVGFGTSHIAANVAAAEKSRQQASTENAAALASNAMSLLVNSVFAQGGREAQPSAATEPADRSRMSISRAASAKSPSRAELLSEIKALQAEVNELQTANQRLQERPPVMQRQLEAPAPRNFEEKRFFKSW